MALAFERYPYWRTSPEQERDVRRSLYKAVMTAGITTGIAVLVNEILTSLKRAGG